MKRLITLTALGTTLLWSCGDKNTPTPSVGSGTLSAKVDGSDWDASLTVQATLNSGILQVVGSDNGGKQMAVTIQNYSGAKEYVLGGPVTSTNMNSGRWTAGLASEQTYVTNVGQGEGTCTISSDNNNQIEGTFSFTAKNTQSEQVTITQGKFKAKY